MNCERFERRLDELLDERLSPESDAELNTHAEDCSACGRMLADYQALTEALAVMAWPEVCEEMGPRVAAEVAAERAEDVRRAKPQAKVPVEIGNSIEVAKDDAAKRERLYRAGWLVAAAAAVLLVSIGMLEWTRMHSASPNGTATTSAAVAPALAATVHDANGRTGNNRTVASVSPVSRSMDEIPAFAGLSPQQRNLMEQMSDGLKPVTHSMSAALRALRRTLPGSEAAARSS